MQLIGVGLIILGIAGLAKGKLGALNGRAVPATLVAVGLFIAFLGGPIDDASTASAVAGKGREAGAGASPGQINPAAKQAETKPVPSSKTPPVEPGAWLEWMIKQEIGAPRVRPDGIAYEPMSDGRFRAVVELQGKENLTNSLMRRGILRDSSTIFERIFTELDKVPDVVQLKWYLPGRDAKGNELDLLAISVTLTKSNASDINWKNFDPTNLPKIADSYDEHPALSK